MYAYICIYIYIYTQNGCGSARRRGGHRAEGHNITQCHILLDVIVSSMFICICVCIRVCVCICMCVYIYIYVIKSHRIALPHAIPYLMLWFIAVCVATRTISMSHATTAYQHIMLRHNIQPHTVLQCSQTQHTLTRHDIRSHNTSYGQSPHKDSRFQRVDSSRILIVRGKFLLSIGDFPESLSSYIHTHTYIYIYIYIYIYT